MEGNAPNSILIDRSPILTEGFGLATDSDGSYPFTYGEGLNFTMNLGISTIDFGTFHLYPNSCKYSQIHPHHS